jgi:hypothetical protein
MRAHPLRRSPCPARSVPWRRSVTRCDVAPVLGRPPSMSYYATSRGRASTAPRVLGVDARGREVLTYVPGNVPRTASPDVATHRALVEVGGLLRRYHEAVSGFSLPPGIGWSGGQIPDQQRGLPQRPRAQEHGLPRGEPGSVLGLRPRLACPAGLGRGAPRLAVRAARRRGGLRAPRVDDTARPSPASAPLVRRLRALGARAARILGAIGSTYRNDRFGHRSAGCRGRTSAPQMGRGGRTDACTRRPRLGRAAPRGSAGGPP